MDQDGDIDVASGQSHARARSLSIPAPGRTRPRSRWAEPWSIDSATASRGVDADDGPAELTYTITDATRLRGTPGERRAPAVGGTLHAG